MMTNNNRFSSLVLRVRCSQRDATNRAGRMLTPPPTSTDDQSLYSQNSKSCKVRLQRKELWRMMSYILLVVLHLLIPPHVMIHSGVFLCFPPHNRIYHCKYLIIHISQGKITLTTPDTTGKWDRIIFSTVRYLGCF